MSQQGKASDYSCRDVTQKATDFLENRLPSATNIAIWRHLEACADCRTYLEQMASVRDSLRKLPDAPMPEAMRKKLLARLKKVTRGGEAK